MPRPNQPTACNEGYGQVRHSTVIIYTSMCSCTEYERKKAYAGHKCNARPVLVMTLSLF